MISSKKLSQHKMISHGFFDRKGGVSKGIYKSLNCGEGSDDKKRYINKNLKIVSRKIGFKKKNLLLLNQVHSNKFFMIKKIPLNKPKGDGAITNKKNIALGILTADCAPILIFDPIRKIIAVVHAGWRGAYKKIIIKIVKKLIKLGSKRENILTTIGPCIAQQNYEVQQKFRKKFLNQTNKNKKYFKFIRKKIYFNLRDYIKGQLEDLGIKNIEIIKKNTYNRKNNFFSSRRSKKNNHDYGRNISVIMIK